MTLYEKRVIADVIKLSIWRGGDDPGSQGWAYYHKSPVTERQSMTSHTQRRGIAKTREEIGLMQPQTKECLQLPEVRRGKAQKEARNKFFSRASGGSTALLLP